MRHRKKRHKLNRFTSWRKATLIGLVKNLFLYQSIKTTKAKALAARPLADRLIGLGRQNNLAKKRQVYKLLGSHRLLTLLFEEIAPRFNTKTSGFTRIINLGGRRGDDAQLAILELTEIKKKEVKKAKKEKKPKPELPIEEKALQAEAPVKEKPPIVKKPSKSFFGGLRKIFKKERDSL